VILAMLRRLALRLRALLGRQDVAYAIHAFARAPGFTLTVSPRR
jgi:hypothetical protein